MHGGEKFGGLDFSKIEPCGTCFAASGSIRQCDPSHSGQPVATADNATLEPLVRTQVDQLAYMHNGLELIAVTAAEAIATI
jgi:hypothetical protein